MLLLDTNVLVYAVGRDHPLRRPAQALLRAADDGRLAITTTPDVIQEFTHVYSLTRPRDETAERALDVARACSPLITSRESDVSVAIELFRRHERIDAFDCLLAATALREGVDGLVSADWAFAAVADLRWIDLADLDVEELAER
jgi:predicted nucleic acid-binding protein